MDEAHVHMHMGIFVNQEKMHPTQFSPHFGGPREKPPRPQHLFSFLPAQPNTLSFSFSLQNFSSTLLGMKPEFEPREGQNSLFEIF